MTAKLLLFHQISAETLQIMLNIKLYLIILLIMMVLLVLMEDKVLVLLIVLGHHNAP